MRAIGYVRQSARRDQDVALSPEQQREEILRLAERDGIVPENLTIIEDLGRSGGRGKEHRRKGYQQVLGDVEAGTVGAVYAKALSRLGRSTQELHRFADLCNKHGVKIVTSKEGTLDPGTPTGKLTFGVFALFAEFERDLRVEAAYENNAARLSRGDTLGRSPYGSKEGENPAAVMDAYRATGSLMAAARQLNDSGLRAPLGGLWHGRTIRKVIERYEPSLLPRQVTRGVKPASPFLLFRLLRCPCGQTLTASRDVKRSGNTVINYRCHRASIVAGHTRPARVSESRVLPWIQREAALLTTPNAVRLAEQNEEKRAELNARRESLGWAVADRLLDREVARKRAEAIDEELAALADQERVVIVPKINWSGPTPELHRALSALWEYIELDGAMRPLRAEWRQPAWRQPPPEQVGRG